MIEVNEAVHETKQETGGFHLSWMERWESLKAGGIGAIAAGILFVLFTLINSQWILIPTTSAANLPSGSTEVTIAASGAIAILSGFLFAVTYRYVIRQDQNVHLKSGAVAAFGLVRGLAQLDIGWQSGVHLLPLLVFMLESFVLFAGVRMAIDWAISHSKVKPF
ncbi:MAG: hypothetical protein DCF22_25990 [Leptolyngbya sp.]|nr:MAG: hypothetical protein DCF22_25990 [Leptolyngbya sp.]